MTLLEWGDENREAMGSVTIGTAFLFGIDYQRELHAYIDDSSSGDAPRFLTLHILRVHVGPLALTLERIRAPR